MSLAVKRSESLAFKRFMSLAVKRFKAMGAVFYLRAGWPKWKPLGIQAPTFHLSEAFG